MQRQKIQFSEMWARVLGTSIFEGGGEVMRARVYVSRIVKLGMSEEMVSHLRAKMQEVVNRYVGGLPNSDPVESVGEFLLGWNALERHLEDISLAFYDF